MVKARTASRAITEDGEVLASLRAASERRSLKLKAFVVYFKQLDLGPHTDGCPNQIVLGTCQIYSVTFHVPNNKSLILM